MQAELFNSSEPADVQAAATAAAGDEPAQQPQLELEAPEGTAGEEEEDDALPPLRLCQFGIYDGEGTPTALTALSSLQTRLHLRGRPADALASEPVDSGALVRWYVNYATTPPEVMIQAMDHLFVVPAEDDAATEGYAPLWQPLVKSISLASRVLCAARMRVSDVWACAADGLSEDELVREWPFVRGQMRALAVRTIRAPGGKSPSWAVLGDLDPEDPDEGGALGRTRKRRQQSSVEDGRAAKRGAAHEVVLEEETPPRRPALEPGEELEVQAYRCRTPRYEGLRRCRSCVINRSEQCRFRFMRRLATRDGRVARDLGTFEHGSGYRLATAKCPTASDGAPAAATAALQAQAAHAAYVLRHLAAPFARVVAQELAFSSGEAVVVVNAKARGAPAKTAFVPKGYSKEGGERQVCDWCSSTMFARYRTCVVCGFEVCLQCAAGWRHTGKPAAVSRLCPHSMCEWHVFSKVSTHMMTALTSGACSLAAEGKRDAGASPDLGGDRETPTGSDPGEGQGDARSMEDVERQPEDGAAPAAALEPQASVVADAVAAQLTAAASAAGLPPRLEPPRLSDAVDDDAFLSQWRLGRPVVVRGVTKRLKESWTPERFVQGCGEMPVQLIEVRTGVEFTQPLRAFFNGFSRPDLRPRPPGRSRSGGGGGGGEQSMLKLKDWPPTKDFAELLPNHFEDLMQALPLPQYTQRTGRRNLVSYLPAYTLPPDLGPKMYVAYGSMRGQSSLGTTCLHMDMSDAVNVLVYVEGASGLPSSIFPEPPKPSKSPARPATKQEPHPSFKAAPPAPEATPQRCQKSIRCSRPNRHPGLCNMNASVDAKASQAQAPAVPDRSRSQASAAASTGVLGGDGTQCERHPLCTRGFKHGGRGGHCSLRKEPAKATAAAKQPKTAPLHQRQQSSAPMPVVDNKPSPGEQPRLSHKKGAASPGGDGTQCERHPLCTRGFKHGGRGGHCSLRKEEVPPQAPAPLPIPPPSLPPSPAYDPDAGLDAKVPGMDDGAAAPACSEGSSANAPSGVMEQLVEGASKAGADLQEEAAEEVVHEAVDGAAAATVMTEAQASSGQEADAGLVPEVDVAASAEAKERDAGFSACADSSSAMEPPLGAGGRSAGAGSADMTMGEVDGSRSGEEDGEEIGGDDMMEAGFLEEMGLSGAMGEKEIMQAMEEDDGMAPAKDGSAAAHPSRGMLLVDVNKATGGKARGVALPKEEDDAAPTDGDGESGAVSGLDESKAPWQGQPAAFEAEELKWLESEGRTGGALWDIFRPEDTERLCEFLWKVAREEGTADRLAHPIHDANFYIDAVLRRRLWEEAGVQSYRFVQHEGEAVFIPAGCPHQVLNIRSSIKVAEDFVSPEHIGRSLELTEQFRALPRGHRRQEDQLGAKDIMLHAVSHALSVRGLVDSVDDVLSDGSEAEVEA